MNNVGMMSLLGGIQDISKNVENNTSLKEGSGSPSSFIKLITSLLEKSAVDKEDLSKIKMENMDDKSLKKLIEKELKIKKNDEEKLEQLAAMIQNFIQNNNLENKIGFDKTKSDISSLKDIDLKKGLKLLNSITEQISRNSSAAGNNSRDNIIKEDLVNLLNKLNKEFENSNLQDLSNKTRRMLNKVGEENLTLKMESSLNNEKNTDFSKLTELINSEEIGNKKNNTERLIDFSSKSEIEFIDMKDGSNISNFFLKDGDNLVFNKEFKNLVENKATFKNNLEKIISRFKNSDVKIKDINFIGNNKMRVKLIPEKLGKLDITLKFEQGLLKAHVESNNQNTLGVFKDNITVLENALKEHNLKVDDFTFNFSDSSSDSKQRESMFSFLQQQEQRGNNQNRNRKYSNDIIGNLDSESETMVAYKLQNLNRVDIRL